MGRHLSAEQLSLLAEARRCGLQGCDPAPGFLSPALCTTLALLLALPSFGFSLLLVPILWLVQYEHTDHRLRQLRRQLDQQAGASAAAAGLPDPVSGPQPLLQA